MSIQDWGSIGELLGSVGVLITLVYLTVQLRQNTSMMRRAARQSVTSIGREAALHVSANPDLLRAQAKFYSNGELTDEDRIHLSWWLTALYRTGESYYMHWEDGLVSDQFWESRLEGLKRALSMDVDQQVWTRTRSQYISEYAAIIDQLHKESVDLRKEGLFGFGADA